MGLDEGLSSIAERSVRIPVAGPAPVNTLVCLTFTTGVAEVIISSDLQRRQVKYRSQFRIEGFDSRRPPECRHSSTASISTVGNTWDDQEFVMAVDALEVTLDSDGHLIYDIHMAYRAGDFLAMTGAVLVSTWLLCYEPPLR